MMQEEVHIFCPDCRGRFAIPREDIIEGDLIECDLCAAEMEVLQDTAPIKIRLYDESNDF